MNQNLKSAYRRWSGSTPLPFAPVRLLAPLLMTVTCATANIALAQSSFYQGNSPPPAQDAATSSSQWPSPNNHSSGVHQASKTQTFVPVPPPRISFPDAPVAFDTGVHTANLEVYTSNSAVVSPVEETADSTTTMLTNLKNATSEKFTGLIGNWGQGGGLMQKMQSMLGQSEIGKMLGSLCLVLGIYFAFVWVMRKISPSSNRGLPKEVIEVLGQVPFGARRTLQLVRLGSKLLLLINSPEGTQPIGEITDPSEVEYLASLCPGKSKKTRGSIRAIQQAANRFVGSTSPAPQSTLPVAAAPQPQPTPTPNNSLAGILKALESAATQGGAVFEA